MVFKYWLKLTLKWEWSSGTFFFMRSFPSIMPKTRTFIIMKSFPFIVPIFVYIFIFIYIYFDSDKYFVTVFQIGFIGIGILRDSRLLIWWEPYQGSSWNPSVPYCSWCSTSLVLLFCFAYLHKIRIRLGF